MSYLVKPFAAPSLGEAPLVNPRALPPNLAAKFRNLRYDDGHARTRDGFNAFTSPPTNPPTAIKDIFNIQFFDGTVETILCMNSAGTSGATSQVQRVVNNALSGVTLDNIFTGLITDRYTAVLSKWAAESKGRIILSDGFKIKSWQGGADDFNDVAGAFPARYLLVGPDNRLFMAWIKDSGNQVVRVRWSVIGLPNGSALDFSDPGSGSIDLTYDSWQITNIWNQVGRIFVGKERSLALLVPTGSTTDAYSLEVIHRNEGVFAPWSVAQHGDLTAFITHRDVVIFDGTNFQGVGGAKRRELFRRINYSALRQVTHYIDGPNNRIGWGLPLDGAGFPTEIWWLSVDSGAWEVDAPFAHTAMAEYTNVDITYVDELVGLVNDLVGVVDSLSTTSTLKGSLLVGFGGGNTWLQSDSAVDDPGGMTAEYVSPAFRPLGDKLRIAGREHVITDRDYLALDEVKITFEDYGQSYTVAVNASIDSGLSFTSIGTIDITTDPDASQLQPRLVEKYINCRLPINEQVQIQLRQVSGGARWGFTDGAIKLLVVGRTKSTS